ncbi:MAG: alpha/beta hydrolase [Sandaracinaceae bacterium]
MSVPQRSRRVRLAITLAVVMLGLVFGVTWLQRALLFHPNVAPRSPGAVDRAGGERVYVESDDGPVEAWFLPARTGAGPRPTVLYTHGNGEVIDQWPDRLEPYRRLGLNVVLAEYRGYGRSAGSPSEAAIRDDLRALYAMVIADPRVDRERLVYHGRSLGGGALGTLLAAHRPRAMIAESTFTSVADIAADMGIPRFLIVDRFDTLRTLEHTELPLLVFHGTRDNVVPVAHGRRLADRPNAELVLYDSGHNDLPPPGSDYWPRIERFLRQTGTIDGR